MEFERWKTLKTFKILKGVNLTVQLGEIIFPLNLLQYICCRKNMICLAIVLKHSVIQRTVLMQGRYREKKSVEPVEKSY